VRRTQAFSFLFLFSFLFFTEKIFFCHAKNSCRADHACHEKIFARKYFPARRRGFFRRNFGVMFLK